MKRTRTAMSLLITALISFAINAGAHAKPNGYDFSYSVTGDKKAVPFQVFDDGKETYFQFKTDESPAIFVVHGRQRDIVQAKKSGMFVVVDGVATEYVLQLGDFSATVKKAGVGNSSIVDESNLRTVMNEKYADAEDKKITEYPNRVEFTPKGDWDQPVKINSKKQEVASDMQVYYVPFSKKSTRLGKQGNKKLSSLMAQAKGALKIEIKGGADRSSDSQAILRAIAIQDAFVAQGVKEEKIVVGELPTVRPGGKNIFMSEVDIYTARATESVAANSDLSQKQANDEIDSTSAKIMRGVKNGALSPEDAARMLAAVPSNPVKSAEREPVKTMQEWSASKSMGHLKAVVADWASKAGWQLSWEILSDYPIVADATFKGSFTEAVTTIAKSMENNQMPIRVIFYDENKVLRVVAAGGE